MNQIKRTISISPQVLVTAVALAAMLGISVRADVQMSSTKAMSSTHASHASRAYSKPSDAVLSQKLTKLQYDVTQHDDTEAPYDNTYWNNHAAGIYVDVVSGEPLFSSRDKYDSHTGWPSFTKPLEPRNIRNDADTKLGFERTEIRSAHANSHLGHSSMTVPSPLVCATA